MMWFIQILWALSFMKMIGRLLFRLRTENDIRFLISNTSKQETHLSGKPFRLVRFPFFKIQSPKYKKRASPSLQVRAANPGMHASDDAVSHKVKMPALTAETYESASPHNPDTPLFPQSLPPRWTRRRFSVRPAYKPPRRPPALPPPALPPVPAG